MIVTLKEFEKVIATLTLVDGKVEGAEDEDSVRDPYTGEDFTPADGERFLIAVLRAYRNPYTMATTEDEALLAKAKERP